MLQHDYTYQAAFDAAQRVNWKVEDIIGGDHRLDYTKPFMPESLAQTDRLTFLPPSERRVLNQIRGHGYLYIFGLVEEFILPYIMDHARTQLHGEDYRSRALLQFASEEAKHIHLFKKFREEFVAGFGTDCAVIGPPEEIAKAVLAHDPMSVALVILHIEWMTQLHYVDSIKDDGDLDHQFKSLLKHHWMEEAQHAKLDTLIIESLAENYTRDEMEEAIQGYLKIGMLLDGGLMQQVQFDVESFQKAIGRTLSDNEKTNVVKGQEQAMRWTYLGSGMTHPNFLGTVDALKPGGRETLEQVAPAFC